VRSSYDFTLDRSKLILTFPYKSTRQLAVESSAGAPIFSKIFLVAGHELGGTPLQNHWAARAFEASAMGRADG
jgi:hypothetical protein